MDTTTTREFHNFSDQIRLQTANLAGLSIGDTIWGDAFLPSSRRTSNNLDPSTTTSKSSAPSIFGAPDFNNNNWKSGQKLAFGNTISDRFNNINGFNGGSKAANSFTNNYNNGEVKNYFNKAVGKPVGLGGDFSGRRKNINSNEGKGVAVAAKKKNGNNDTHNNNNNNNNVGVDKRFKTLPPSEALPRNEAVGGYIFVCNNDTMQENLKRQLFGLPPRYRDSVRAITPGLPLFLYNYSTHQLHGIFEASSFGGTNIDPMAWEDKKCAGESRFPAQVRVVTRNICEPLEEDSFRPILHHYDGPKFRLELSVPEALALLDIFAENNV